MPSRSGSCSRKATPARPLEFLAKKKFKADRYWRSATTEDISRIRIARVERAEQINTKTTAGFARRNEL
jgi:hypothetical protein